TRCLSDWSSDVCSSDLQPPQPEHLLLSSSPAARALSPFADSSGGALGAGGAELEPERQTAWEVGVEQRLGGTLKLDVSYWSRQRSEERRVGNEWPRECH